MASILVGLAATTGTAATTGLIGTAGAVTAGGLLTAGAIGASAAGILQQGRVSAAQAESQQNIAEFNAQVQKREATAQRRRATFAQKRQAKRGVAIKSALIAKLGAAGGIGSLVAADLSVEQAAEIELENLLIGFEGEIGVQRALTQSKLDELQADVFGARKKPARKAAAIGVGTTLLTGFGRRLNNG